MYRRINSKKFPVLGTNNVREPDVTIRKSARSLVCMDKCVPAVREVEVPDPLPYIALAVM
jgi:hypothetical protein